MVFKEGQDVYFLNRIKKKHHNTHMWVVEPAIVVSDKGNNHRVEVKISDQNIVSIRRRVIFETKDKKNAEESARQLVFVVASISTAVMAVCLLTRGPLLRLIFGSVEADVMEAARIYFF